LVTPGNFSLRLTILKVFNSSLKIKDTYKFKGIDPRPNAAKGYVLLDDGTSMENSDIEDIDDYEEEVEKTPKRVVSIEDLEHMIEDAIRNEEYEIAAEIRDRIEKLKKESK
jgi:excinuclease UvrABC helicase subunit UvrB